MVNFSVVGLYKIVIVSLKGEYFITIFAKVFAGERNQTGFRVGLHTQVGAGGDFEGNFHVVIFEILLGKRGLERDGAVEVKELVEEVNFFIGIHG